MVYIQHIYIFVLMVVLTTAETRQLNLVKEDHAFIGDERIIKKQNNQGKVEISRVMPHNLNLVVPAAAIGFKNDVQQKNSGIGHSFANGPEAKPMLMRSIDDFQHHAFTGEKTGSRKMSETNEVEAKHKLVRSIDDFRPTRPGHSPGIGHSFTGKKNDDNEQIAEANDVGANHSQNGNIKDFRPTAPGHSPGVGHSFTGKKDDNEQIAEANDVGAKHTQNGNIEDFRPTRPGHSPGIGHSFTEKKYDDQQIAEANDIGLMPTLNIGDRKDLQFTGPGV